MSSAERPKSRLRQLLERPEARERLRKAFVPLLATCVLSIGVIGLLAIWHLVRRGRLIRQRLAPPRDVRLPDLTDRPRRPPDGNAT